MPTYNKLVRDKIPQIIESKGKQCRARILDEAQYLTELKLKLREETEEYNQASDSTSALEELADILEVVHALASAHGADWDQLEALRIQIAEARGGFKDRVCLIDVDEA
ncbi:nucleoside triphosphate pyrophosphohydrolase [Paenibacillus koleovorans]|uniref:nucleoside triphosphate pyrophosphohydrolase n=1 Tax=Paenibacillus koleovorans TaxID=121608 RepID=UPI000FD98781|nr:nucleoside triphosphate pyrophosphohydrolase [Paenibacillus koleovorans]